MPWGQVANLRGPQGIQGEPGEQGLQGPPGEDGAGIEIAGSVATYAALPTTLGPEDAGDGYLVTADGLLYIWDGAAFPADGAGVAFRGPQGIQGADGAEGPQGDPGPRGSRWFNGAGAPTTVADSLPGDYYLDTTDGTVYVLTA
jgi:hypothetical protein